MNLRRGSLLAAAFIVSALSAQWAAAVPIYKLEATIQFRPDIFGSFSLTFEDLDSDALLSLDELQTFSRLTALGGLFPTLTAAPDIAGIADAGAVDGLSRFGVPFSGGTLDSGPDVWTYSLTEVRNTVPEPTTLSLLGLSLAGLGWRMRRQRA